MNNKQVLKNIFVKALIRIFIRKATGQLKKEDIRKILIIRNEYLGDIVTFIPALTALRNYFAGARLYLMTSEIGREVLENSPLVDEFILADREKVIKMGLFEFVRLARLLRKERFDLIISTPNTFFKAQLCAFLSGAPYRIGYNNINSGYLFNLLIKFEPDNNEVRECFKIPEALGIKYGPQEYPDLWPGFEDSDFVSELLKEGGIAESDFVVGINLGSKQPANWWLPQRWAEVINSLHKDRGYKIILIGGDENRGFSDTVIRAAQITLLNTVGRLDVKQLALVVRRCNLIVSHDSGVAHMAVLAGIPAVVLFGKSSYTKWGYPDNPRYRAVYKDVCCRLCGKIKCEDNICMKLIRAEDVLMAVREVLG